MPLGDSQLNMENFMLNQIARDLEPASMLAIILNAGWLMRLVVVT